MLRARGRAGGGGEVEEWGRRGVDTNSTHAQEKLGGSVGPVTGQRATVQPATLDRNRERGGENL